MSRRLAVLAGAVLLAGATPPLHAEPPPRPPIGAIAWYRHDPSPPTPTSEPAPGADPMARELLLATLRAGVSTRLFGDETAARALELLLAAAQIGDAPHLVALTDFAAHRQPDGRGMNVDRLGVVIHVVDPQRIPLLLRTIRALAVASAKADADTLSQSPVVLPGGLSGVSLSSSAWEPWMGLTWAVEGDSFLLGIGAGALEAWLAPRAAEGGDADDAAWENHADAIDAGRPASRPFFEAFVDLAALRRAFPHAFGSGRTPRMLAALELTGADNAMMHARFLEPAGDLPPLIGLDTTRSERGTVSRSALSMSVWPEDAGLDPPPGTFLLASEIEWRSLYARVMAIYEATVPDDDVPEFRARRAHWEKAHGEALDRVLGSLGPRLIVSDVPAPALPVPGLATLYAPLTASAPPTPEIEAMIEGMLAPFRDRLAASGRAGRRVWALQIDSRGLVRMPAWGVVEARPARLLVGGWGIPVVTDNRARLAP